MEKSTIALIAALSAASVTPALAHAPRNAAERILNPGSIAELLDPIPNPIETLKALQASEPAPVQLADADISIGVPGPWAHHHHHHHHRRRVYNYHHHHHHHHHHHYHYQTEY